MAAPFQEKPVPAMGTPFDKESLPGGSGTVNAKLRLLTDQQDKMVTLLAGILMGGTVSLTGLVVIEGDIGDTNDAAAVGDVSGSVNAHLRGMDKILADVWDSSTHQIRTEATIALSGVTVDIATPLGVSGIVFVQGPVGVSGDINAHIPQPLGVSGTVSANIIGTVPVSFDQPIVVSGTVNVGNLSLPNPIGVSGTLTVNQGASGSVPWSVVIENEVVIASGSTVIARGGVSDISGVCNGASQLFSPANPQRTYLLIHNPSSGSIWFNFAFAATSGLSSIELAPSEKFIMQENFVSTDDVFIFGHPGRLWTAKEYPINISNDWRLDFEIGHNTTLYIVFGV